MLNGQAKVCFGSGDYQGKFRWGSNSSSFFFFFQSGTLIYYLFCCKNYAVNNHYIPPQRRLNLSHIYLEGLKNPLFREVEEVHQRKEILDSWFVELYERCYICVQFYRQCIVELSHPFNYIICWRKFITLLWTSFSLCIKMQGSLHFPSVIPVKYVYINRVV